MSRAFCWSLDLIPADSSMSSPYREEKERKEKAERYAALHAAGKVRLSPESLMPLVSSLPISIVLTD